MKNTMITILAVATLLSANLVSNARTPNSGTDEFEITPVGNLYLGKNITKVWTVNYSENENPVTITLQKNKNEKEFVVRSEFFEVMYVSSDAGFGVKQIRSSQREVPAAITTSVLNKQQMENQRMITPNKVTDEYAMELIASYLPDLLNDNYKHLIY